MKEGLSESARRMRRISAAIFLLIGMVGALLVWQVDLFHLQFGYRDVKSEYLASGMPWTSEDLYRSITPEQAKKREELVESANAASESFQNGEHHRFHEVSEANAIFWLKQIASINIHLNKVVELSNAPLIGLTDLNEGYYYRTDSQRHLKEAVQLLALRAEWRITVGRFEEGRNDFEAAYRIAKNLGSSEVFLGYIIGTSALTVVDLSVVKAANTIRENHTRLTSLESMISESIASHPLPVNAFRGEALTHIAYARNADLMHDVFTLTFENGVPGVVMQPPKISGDPRTVGRRSLATAFMRLWAGVGETMKEHPGDQEKWFAALQSEITLASNRGGIAGKIIDHYTVDPDSLLDNLKRSRAMRLVNLSLLRGARMSLEGKSQSEIEAAMELDPYSGRRLVWKKSGATLKVWSVGPNGADDGGIDRLEYLVLKSSTGASSVGVDAYDIPAILPWKATTKPSSMSGPPPGLAREIR